jgi:hypothetical protein
MVANPPLHIGVSRCFTFAKQTLHKIHSVLITESGRANIMTEIRCRKSGLLINNKKCESCESIKWCATQDKIAKTKSNNNASNENKIMHLGIWLTKTPLLKLSRETYAEIDKRNSFWDKKHLLAWLKQYNENPQKYEDESCKTYSNEYCQQQQKDCLKNYDLNIERFSKISRDRFEKVITHLLNSAPFEQIYDLSRCNCCGIYVMVLDQYKQLYIGKAHNIKDRIKQHWYKKKAFDRLIFGNVNNSILSIDSFGALDTTRIYILPMPVQNLDEAEAGIVNSIHSRYRLNRIPGGINLPIEILCSNSNIGKLAFSEEIAITDFTEIPKKKAKKPIREKYIKTIDYVHYTKGGAIKIEAISVGNIICLEHKNNSYWGKVNKISPCYITICQYGLGEDLEISKQQIEKQETSYNSEKRLSINCIQKIIQANEEHYQKEKVFYRTISHKEINLWE